MDKSQQNIKPNISNGASREGLKDDEVSSSEEIAQDKSTTAEGNTKLLNYNNIGLSKNILSICR